MEGCNILSNSNIELDFNRKGKMLISTVEVSGYSFSTVNTIISKVLTLRSALHLYLHVIYL